MYVKGTKNTTSISRPAAIDNGDVTFYTIDGRRVDNIVGYRGVVIVKCGDKTWKAAR